MLGGADVGQDPRSRSLSVRLNKEKRGSFSEDKNKIGGHLVRTHLVEGLLMKPSVL